MTCRCGRCSRGCLAARVPGHRVHRCGAHATEAYRAMLRRRGAQAEARFFYQLSWRLDREQFLAAVGRPDETGGEAY